MQAKMCVKDVATVRKKECAKLSGEADDFNELVNLCRAWLFSVIQVQRQRRQLSQVVTSSQRRASVGRSAVTAAGNHSPTNKLAVLHCQTSFHHQVPCVQPEAKTWPGI